EVVAYLEGGNKDNDENARDAVCRNTLCKHRPPVAAAPGAQHLQLVLALFAQDGEEEDEEEERADEEEEEEEAEEEKRASAGKAQARNTNQETKKVKCASPCAACL